MNTHHNNEYIWVDSDGSGGWKVPSGKGQRLIILHAGGVDGWVHMEWMTQQLLPQLEEPTVIILDNDSYHNKQKDKPPNSIDKKAASRHG